MALDLAGKRFGRLLAIERVKVPGANNAMWRCQCDCGQETVAAAANLGKTTMSCGCLQRETARETLKRGKYGHIHGGTGSAEYRAWQLIKRRCYNPNDEKYPHYGGRGIQVCERWRNSFPNFLADMGPRPSPLHSIDRKDVNGNYTLANCQWATDIEQMRNTTRNVFVEIDGQRHCVSEWCEIMSIPIWKVYELLRPRGAKRNLPPKCSSTEEAVRYAYQHYFRR